MEKLEEADIILRDEFEVTEGKKVIEKENDLNDIKKELLEIKNELNERKTHHERKRKNNKKQNLKRNIVLYIAVFVLGALIMYGLIYRFPQQFSTIITLEESSVTITDEGIADAVEKVYDSVVIVSTYVNDELTSTGSGFVYKVDGEVAYILTNHHVIEDATTVNVTFTDGSIVQTTIVGSDEYEDVAVLTVSSDDILAVAEIGSSDDMRLGDTTFAVGGPIDSEFSWTVTRGILSGKDRMVSVTMSDSSTYYMNVIQTDTAINSGNSGGPLCNSNGEVIGITTLKIMDDGVEGMGFAIPIEQVVEVAEEIIDGVNMDNPYLGIGMYDLSIAYSPAYPEYTSYQEVIEEYELSGGVIITEVTEDSSADLSGVEVGDIIYSFNGELIDSSSRLKYELYNCHIGDTIEVLIIRDGEKITLNIELLN